MIQHAVIWVIAVGLTVFIFWIAVKSWETTPALAIPGNFFLWAIYYFGLIRTQVLYNLEIPFKSEVLGLLVVGTLSTILSGAVSYYRKKHDYY